MEHYQGLVNGCAPGTHARLVALVVRNGAPRTGVLDVGAGSGALLVRLRDAGFKDLHGTDLAAANWALTDVPYTRVDLNGDFSRAFDRKFRLVCMSEVVEHLDSPRHALAEARSLLDDDGWLALTIPNVGFWEGRLKFLLTGELWGFGESHYRRLRHISPVTRGQLRLMLKEIGFDVVALTTAGSFATPLRWALLSPLWAPLVAVGGMSALGECIVVLARKTAPDVALSLPLDFDAAWQTPT
jgi:SAM-dependent methyltransferase